MTLQEKLTYYQPIMPSDLPSWLLLPSFAVVLLLVCSSTLVLDLRAPSPSVLVRELHNN